jgi:hypothetical protein
LELGAQEAVVEEEMQMEEAQQDPQIQAAAVGQEDITV